MPTRSCAGCRRRREKQELLRLVATSVGRLKLDAEQRALGRGVYLCPDRGCLERACIMRAFTRALRRGLAELTVESLHTRLLGQFDEAVRVLREQARQDGRARDDGTDDGTGDVLVVEPRCATQLARWAAQRDALAAPAQVGTAAHGTRGRRGRGHRSSPGG